jgi:predicted MFS family arabinose efflux permease
MRITAASEDRAHRLALSATCLIGFSLFFDLYFTQVILGPIAEGFGTVVLRARYTMVAATAGVVFAPLFAGRLPQRKGMQVVILATMALSGALEAAAPSLGALTGMRFCQGLLIGALFIQAMGRVASIHRARFGALSNGLFVSSTTLGGFASRFLPGYLIDQLGVAGTFVVMASVLLAICVAVLVSPMPKADTSPGCARDASGAPAAAAAQVRRSAFLFEYVLGFCVLFAQVSLFTYLPVRLAQAPFYLANREIAAIAFVFLLGAVSAPMTLRVTRDDLSKSAVSLFFGCIAVGALMTAVSNLYVVAAGLALFAAGVFAQQAMLSRRLTARAGAATPRIFAVYMSVYYLGGSAGSYFCGDVFATSGFSGVVFVIACAAVLGGSALYLREAWSPIVTRRTAPAVVRPPFSSDPAKYESEP